MTLKHFMVDLETLGTEPGDAIVSIGLVQFDPPTRTLIQQLDIGIKLDRYTRINPATVMWWLGQSEEARQQLIAQENSGMPEFEALILLSGVASRTVTKPSELRLWGNGAGFDNVMLDAAFLRNNLPLPWRYSGHRCYRTLRALAPEGFTERQREGAHTALGDALHQTRTLFDVMDALGMQDLA